MKTRPNRERRSVTHSFTIYDPKTGACGYIATVGLYDNGLPCELFVKRSDGAGDDGLLNPWCIAVSIALQHGCPLSDLAEKMMHQRIPPAGKTDNPEIKSCTSLPDYLFRWMALRFAS